MTDGSNRQVAGTNTTSEYVISLWRPPPIPCCLRSPGVTKKKRGCLPVRMSPLLTSAPSVSAKWAHGSCINQQHGDPRLSPDAPPPVIWLPEPCHYAAALSQSLLNKYETAPLCVTNFYIQQRSRESKGTFFAHLWAKTLKRWASLKGREQREWGTWAITAVHITHSYLRCMIPVAISNMYTLTCASHTHSHKMWLQSIKYDAFDKSKGDKMELSHDIVAAKVMHSCIHLVIIRHC